MKEALNRAMNIGEQMLLSGAEVHRVEDTLYRLCASFGAERTDVFIITSSMIVTIHTPGGEIYTETRRITASGTDFERLDKLNNLSRRICYQGLEVSEIDAEIKKITNVKTFPFWSEVFAYAIIAGAFTLFFGGTWFESLVSLVIGAVIRLLIFFSDCTVKNKIFAKFIASFASASAAYLAKRLGIITDVDEIIIGNIMTLIPGIGLTNALRDLFTGDSIAGLLRTVEAVLNALAIAAGYFMLILIMGGVGAESVTPPEIYPWLQITTGTVGTLGFTILFNIRGKKMAVVGLGGLLSWGVHLLVFYLSESETLGYFISAAFMSVYSELMARASKSPTTTFIIPTLIALVPGASLYKTMRFALSGNFESFTDTGLYTLELSAALALGIIVSSAFFKPIIRHINLRSHRRKMLDRHVKK